MFWLQKAALFANHCCEMPTGRVRPPGSTWLTPVSAAVGCMTFEETVFTEVEVTLAVVIPMILAKKVEMGPFATPSRRAVTSTAVGLVSVTVRLWALRSHWPMLISVFAIVID